MNINSITITSEASKAYQKYCVSLTATDLNDGDIELLKTMAITESLKGIEELAGNISTERPEVRTTVCPMPEMQTPNRPQAPRPPYQGSHQGARKYSSAPKTSGPSEKQINILKKAGYSPDQIDLMTGKDAAKIIEEYWQRTNYQPKNPAPQYSQYPQQSMNNYQNYQYPDDEY